MKYTILINGRFLSRKLTGVERVAYNLIDELSFQLDCNGERFLGDKSKVKYVLVQPKRSQVASPWENIQSVAFGHLTGHLWEQIELPFFANKWPIVSLCNTAPLFSAANYVYIHDAQPFAIPGNFSLPFRSWYQILYQNLVTSSRIVFTNSCFSRDELSHFCPSRSPLPVVVYPGSSLMSYACSITQDEQSSILASYSVKSNSYMLAVGSSSLNKNLVLLRRAYQAQSLQLPPLIVVGSSGLKHFSGSAGTEWPDDIRHVGYIPDKDLACLYINAFYFIFPSIYEGFGLPPVEAMSLSCPVISSNTSCLPEILGNAAIYFDPLSLDSLLSSLSIALGSQSLRASVIAAGEQHSRRYSWSSSALKLFGLVEKDIFQ